ncbi:MAG: cytochrome c oxidase subunit 3, partial [Xanthomonadales bacterium]|nr:cytochrome c oxidase subunit 3 [Gammaproteobacteria bacterium]NNK03451.1 cytochrome c oxidase subunit 3 [Xanthomonadales bacterium]
MATHAENSYYVPHGSKWPIVGSLGMITMLASAAGWMNGSATAQWTFWLGAAILIFMLFGWFGTVIRESEAGMYSEQVSGSFRLSMSWFIFSEVMFFAVFFGALFYVRALVIPWLGGEGTGASTNEFLWQGYTPAWPTSGPANVGGDFQTIPAFGIPFLNTLILLTSGLTVTLAHHALKKEHRNQLVLWLAAT